MLNEALQHHEAGRIGMAQALYRRILAEDPDDPDSLHLLGLITSEQGNPAAGAALIERALANRARARAVSTTTLRCRTVCLAAARTPCGNIVPRSRCVRNRRKSTTTWRPRCAISAGDAEAVAHYRQAAEHAPGIAEIWYNLANALGDQGVPPRWRPASAAPSRSAGLHQRACQLWPLADDAGALGGGRVAAGRSRPA